MEKWELAFEDWKQGMKYKEIADKYGVSLGTVKSWASRKWKQANKKKVAAGCNKRLQSNEERLQPKIKTGAPKGNQNAFGNKGGAPKGNQNAIGNKGGAPEGNKNNLKHGIYETLLYPSLSEEEKALFELEVIDKAEKLREAIHLCDIRIMRFMRKISEAEGKPGGLLADSVKVSKRQIGKEDAEVKLNFTETTTNTIAAHNLVLKYNETIDRIMKTKLKYLEDLSKLEENKGSSETMGTSIQIYLPDNKRGDNK